MNPPPCGDCRHLGPLNEKGIGYCWACCTWQRVTDTILCQKWSPR